MVYSLRSQHKKEQAMKKALKTTDDDTSVDVTLTIMDIADIDCVEGSFKVKFKLHAIYKFDVKQKKETAVIHTSMYYLSAMSVTGCTKG
jgi:hypothetical protein